jgi:hypothetical protein
MLEALLELALIIAVDKNPNGTIQSLRTSQEKT